MSTYVFLQCASHSPPLTADDESGQHLYSLPQIFADIAGRDSLVSAWELGVIPDDYFRRNTVAFLAKHRQCLIIVVDEYKQVHTSSQ